VVRLTNPDVIRRGLLFKGGVPLPPLLRRDGDGDRRRPRPSPRPGAGPRDGAPVSVETRSPERRHVVGGAIFGLGWAIAAACPGPIAAQLGQGIAWSLATTAGVVAGIALYLARERRAAPRAELTPARAPG
jgi:uncharacterized protein